MTQESSESTLIEAARSGSRTAFDQLAAAALPKARGVVVRMIGHPEDSEDVLQQALMKAWNSLPSFRGESQFGTWLISIATRQAIDHLRAGKRWRAEAQVAYANLCAESEEMSGEVMGAMTSPDFSFEVREHISYCFTCVGRSLPPDEQATLVLREVMDLSNQEAANVLGVSESVLRHRLATAREAMEERYEGLCALVNKAGICHQCKGLSEAAAMVGAKASPIPSMESFADRMAIVRELGSSPNPYRSRRLHDVFWRATSEIEDKGLGSTEPLSGCGEDDDAQS